MALVIDGLTKRFGTIQALDGVTFTVQQGGIFGFLGANGAGKTIRGGHSDFTTHTRPLDRIATGFSVPRRCVKGARARWKNGVAHGGRAIAAASGRR